MAPAKSSPRKLGSVAPDRRRFRARVWLNGKHQKGPRRTRGADAGADLALVRACQTREEIPALLLRLRAGAASSNAPPLAAPRASGDTTASPAVAPRRRSEVGSPAVSGRKRAVDGTSRPSSTASTDHSHPPRNLESAFHNGPPRKRLRGQSARPTPAAAHSPRPQAVASTSSSGMPVLLVLRGLNIQYPFSQLILAKLKDTEVRDYALGHRNIANPDEEMFLIETPPKYPASAAVGPLVQGPPPRQAQVVGTVSFSKSEQYKKKAAWNLDRRRHRIKRGSALDWQQSQGDKYAWRIGQVRCFQEPVPVSDHTQTGYPTPKALMVRFAPDSGGTRPSSSLVPPQDVETKRNHRDTAVRRSRAELGQKASAGDEKRGMLLRQGWGSGHDIWAAAKPRIVQTQSRLKLRTVAPGRRGFCAGVRLNGTASRGPLRTRAADADVDLAFQWSTSVRA